MNPTNFPRAARAWMIATIRLFSVNGQCRRFHVARLAGMACHFICRVSELGTERESRELTARVNRLSEEFCK